MLTSGQLANGIAAAFTAIAGLVFVTSYALVAKWWKSLEGRLMMLLATAISSTCLLTLTMTLGGFTVRDDWLRVIQATLIISVGSCFIYYTVLVWKVQKNKGRK